MPTYETPAPINLAINLQVGAVEIIAGDRSDTVVTVSPANPAKAIDRRGAEETKVDFDGQRLTITGPRPRISLFGPWESVDVTVELPTGSRLTAKIADGDLRTVGRLGATRLKCPMGPVEVDTTVDLWLRAGHGNVTVDTGHADIEITADHGQIRVGTVDWRCDPQGVARQRHDRGVRRRPRREALLRRSRDREGARLRRPRRPRTATSSWARSRAVP